MTVRTDITYNMNLSPRLAEIASGSDELTAQDHHDTARREEIRPSNGSQPKLVDSAGKETVGGVQVAITTTLNNLQYAFAATSPIQTGTITTPDSNGVTLTDSAATFVTNNVARGDWVINFTDQSVTEILSVDSETQVTTRGLRDGTNNQFNSADAYKIWNVEEAELTGGNFVAVDDVGGDINPLFPTFGRFVSKSAATAAAIVSTGASGLTAAEAAQLDGIFAAFLHRQKLTDAPTNNFVIYEADGITPKYTVTVTGPSGEAISLPTGSPAERSSAV